MSTTQRRIVMCGELVYLLGVLSWALFTLKARTDSKNAVIAARVAMARQIEIAQSTERWQGFRAQERIEYAQQVKEAAGRYGFSSYHQDEWRGDTIVVYNRGVRVYPSAYEVELEPPDWNRLPMLDYQWIDVTIPPGVYEMDHPFRPLPYFHYHMDEVAIYTTSQCGIEYDDNDPSWIDGGYFQGATYAICDYSSVELDIKGGTMKLTP